MIDVRSWTQRRIGNMRAPEFSVVKEPLINLFVVVCGH